MQPIFDALKPEGEFGFVHAGKVGAGHFAKMVHNGIEYAHDAGLRRGLGAARGGARGHRRARGLPQSWREGTVIRSWLLDLPSARWTRTST